MVSPVIEMVNFLLKQYSVVTGANNTQAFRVVREQYDGSSVTDDVRQVIYIEQEKEWTMDRGYFLEEHQIFLVSRRSKPLRRPHVAI